MTRAFKGYKTKPTGRPPKPTCARGHDKTGDGALHYTTSDGRVMKICRECRRLREAAYSRGETVPYPVREPSKTKETSNAE